MARRYYKKSKETDPCVAVTVYLPKSLSERLDDLSAERGMPKSRLISYAVDNELDQEVPFQYHTDIPETPYIEFSYAKEAQKILDYMRRWLKGVSRDMLVLARRDIGLNSRDDVLLGFRELVAKGFIEERGVVDSKFSNWNKDYRVAHIVNTDVRKLNPLAEEKKDEEPSRRQTHHDSGTVE